MATPCRPEIVQDTESKKWYIVTSYHKPGHPAKKYDVTEQIHTILKFGIDMFVKQVEKEHREAEEALTKAEKDALNAAMTE